MSQSTKQTWPWIMVNSQIWCRHICTPASSPNTSHPASGQLEANRRGRLGQLFQAQPCYQVSWNWLMHTLLQTQLLLSKLLPNIYSIWHLWFYVFSTCLLGRPLNIQPKVWLDIAKCWHFQQYIHLPNWPFDRSLLKSGSELGSWCKGMKAWPGLASCIWLGKVSAGACAGMNWVDKLWKKFCM